MHRQNESKLCYYLLVCGELIPNSGWLRLLCFKRASCLLKDFIQPATWQVYDCSPSPCFCLLCRDKFPLAYSPANLFAHRLQNNSPFSSGTWNGTLKGVLSTLLEFVGNWKDPGFSKMFGPITPPCSNTKDRVLSIPEKVFTLDLLGPLSFGSVAGWSNFYWRVGQSISSLGQRNSRLHLAVVSRVLKTRDWELYREGRLSHYHTPC